MADEPGPQLMAGGRVGVAVHQHRRLAFAQPATRCLGVDVGERGVGRVLVASLCLRARRPIALRQGRGSASKARCTPGRRTMRR